MKFLNLLRSKLTKELYPQEKQPSKLFAQK